MSYDSDKVKAGAQRIDIVQIDLGACLWTFGDSNCGATGEPCVNSWQSCKAPQNYDETGNVLTVSICTPVRKLPAGFGLIPCLDSVSFDPGDVTPDDGIGKVGSVTFKASDLPHDDVGIDPYVSQRAVSALKRGTFWPRLRARWPYYQGRALRWYTGYVYHPFDLANLKCRHYVIENMSGFGGKAGVSIKAKDPLILVDEKRAIFPRKSTGKLATAMTDVSVHTTLDVTTSEPTEYDLYPFETVSAVRMKGEVVQYTGTTIITGGIRLTGITRAAPGAYVTEKEAHDIGDDVQKCAWFDDMSPPEIMGRLLILGAEADAAWVPYATTWQTLYSFWLGSQNLTRLVCDPEPVRQQISDILLQSNCWGLWWDDVAQVFGFEVFRPAALGESVPVIDDGKNIVNVIINDDTNNVINDCVFWYSQIDPTKAKDDTTNYRDGENTVDPQSISPVELGSTRTKNIFGVWHAATPAATVQRISERLVTARGSVPFVVELELHRKDDAIETAGFIDLQTSAAPSIDGTTQIIRMRVVKADHGGRLVKYTARQDFISDRFGLIAPDSMRGTTWATATDEQRKTYVFIADNNGFYSDGTPGKRIF